jgi:hypothetical protein
LNAYWRSPGKLPKGDRFRNRKCGPVTETRATQHIRNGKAFSASSGAGAGRVSARVFHHERPAHLGFAMAGLRQPYSKAPSFVNFHSSSPPTYGVSATALGL